MSLYDITCQMAQLQEMLETGAINEEIYRDTIDSLDVETKVSNICAVIRNLQAETEMYKAEKDRLAAKQQATENGVKRLKESLLNYLQVTNQSKVKSGIFSVGIGSTEKVVVTDERKIPKEFLIEQQPKIDLAGLKKAIKEGEEFEGVTIESNQHVRIR